MRVLIINLTNGIGSTGKIVKGLASILNEFSEEVYIGYGFFEEVGKNTYCIKHGGIKTVQWAILKSRVTGWMGFDSKKKTTEFLAWIDSIKPDLIHLHNIHTGYINVELLFSYIKNNKIPVVWTLHDCWSFTGRCSHFVNSKCKKWETGCHSCPDLKTYPKSYFFDWSAEMYRRKRNAFTGVDNLTIVTPSDWLRSFLPYSFLREYNAITIHNGVDVNKFKPVDKKAIKNKYDLWRVRGVVLAVAASWSESKGLSAVYQVANMLGNRFKVIVVGLNKKQMSCCPENVLGIERTNDQNELVELYSAADVFINCTLADNFPTVNLEALSCGTPVITFNTGGSPECVPEGAGFVVEQNDLNSMVNKIKYLISRPQERSVYREIALDNFDQSKLFVKYISLYHKILKVE